METMQLNKRKLRVKDDVIIPILFLAPIFLLFTGVLMNSIVQAVYMSFFDWNGIYNQPFIFAGIDNYIGVLKSPNFWNSMKNVGVFIAQGTLIQMPIAFLLALVINKGIRFSKAYKTLFFLPMIVPLTAVGLMWTFILYPNGGVIDALATALGNPDFNVNFTGDPTIAIYSVAMVSAWIYVGYNMVIFSSGMAAIPSDLYEAARIDGANELQQILFMTIPMLRETFKIYLVMMVTGSLKTFDLIFIMTKGGPNRATEAPAIMMYQEVFAYNDYGAGNAIATIILVLGLVFSLIVNKYLSSDD